MNRHRLYRQSKRIQGRGFFKDLGKKLINVAVDDKTKQFVKDKLNTILSGSGMKKILSKQRGRGLENFILNK